MEGASSLLCWSRCGTSGHDTLLGKAAVKERMQLLLQNDQCALAAPPGNDQDFLFFCAAQKGADRTDLCFSICRFSQVVFIPQAQPHAQSLFLFPIVFGIKLIHFFDFFDEKEERCSRKFDRLICCFDPLSITPFDSAKNANCFEKCNVFGNGKCELSAIQEGRN